MRNVTLVLFLSILALSPRTIRAQASNDSFDWWSETLESVSLGDALSSLESGQYQWPSLPAKNEDEEADWIALSKNFVTVLAQNVRENRGADAADLVRFAKQYFSIESALKKSGGYTNQVIANVYGTYGVYFSASALAQDGSLRDDILKMLEARESSKPTSVSQFLLTHLEHDPFLSGHRNDIEQIGKDVDSNLILAGMRLQELIPALDGATAPETTTGLLDAPAAAALLSRITLTEYASTILLPGLIEFIESGGEVDDLVRGSEKPIRDVLGDDVYDYKYELLGVRSLSSQAMLNLLEDAQGEKNDKYLFE